MKKIQFLSIILAVVVSACSIDDKPSPVIPKEEVPFVNGTTLVFVSQQEGQTLLGKPDEYSKALSKFDIASRTQNAANTKEQEYLSYAAGQAQEWQENEIDVMKLLINNVKTKIEGLGLKLNFPEKIRLVKSTLKEEGSAISYTRTDYIVLKGEVTEEFIIHELFHILTRFNPAKKDELYKTINFDKTNRIEYPLTVKDNIITNPDAPFLEHSIKLTIDGMPKEAVFVLYSEKDYESGSFFTYMKQKLMLVEGSTDNKTAVLKDGMPVLLDFSAASDLNEKIGRNTSYTLHPEEILADHFVTLVKPRDATDPSFIEAMKAVLIK